MLPARFVVCWLVNNSQSNADLFFKYHLKGIYYFVSLISIFRRSIVWVLLHEWWWWRGSVMKKSILCVCLLCEFVWGRSVCHGKKEPFVFYVCFLYTQDTSHKMWNEITWNLPATGLSSVYLFAQSFAGMGINIKDFWSDHLFNTCAGV